MSYKHEYDRDRHSAELLARQASDYDDDPQISSSRIAAAQVHATLALAAATMAVAERHEE